MKILLIGGAGYIGSHVARELLDNNVSVTVFDNLSSGQRVNIFPESEFIEGDILDYTALCSAMTEGFDGIFHFAALKAAGESMVSPQKYSTNNINGTINILNAATETNVRFFVFSSSAAVYGDPVYFPINEEHPTNPQNYYGFTKLEIERILTWYDRLCNIRFAALRYFNAAGYDAQKRIRGLEKNPQNLLPCVMEVACGKREILSIYGNDYPTPDGTGIRDYIHVSDLASAHLKAYDYITDHKKSITLNLGSETGISVQTIIEKARSITGRPIPAKVVARRDGDTARLFASSGKAELLLGWKARCSDVDSLIKTTWEAYKNSS
ncbi:MAG: UDP-glucose 4-epimerase GalE [Chitinispirillaceae bacterium]|nr:UDP-glucose 4-epimerase GalE [Chitinispirillaceae bacterium]